MLSSLLWNCVSLRSLPIRQEGLVADPGPGEGPRGPAPPLFLDQTEKFFLETAPPLPKSLDDHPPTPRCSQGLGPALRLHMVMITAVN